MAAIKNSRHIFVVENNKVYLDMMDYIFQKDFSFRFVNLKSGEECLEHLYLNPDLIVLDYSLPGMNGFETLLEIKKHNPHIYVIVLLSDKDDKLPSELFEAGADEYILKETLSKESLTEKVESYLSKDNFTRSLRPKLRRKPSVRQVAYFVLLLLLVSAGVYYYQ